MQLYEEHDQNSYVDNSIQSNQMSSQWQKGIRKWDTKSNIWRVASYASEAQTRHSFGNKMLEVLEMWCCWEKLEIKKIHRTVGEKKNTILAEPEKKKCALWDTEYFSIWYLTELCQ